MLDPNLIDPVAFAAEGGQLSGKLALSSLDERVRAHEYLAGHEAEIAFTLQGGRDRWQRLFLDVRLEAVLMLVCQRCMEPLPFSLNEQARIVLFENDGQLDEAMLADEELEGMVPAKELDVRELVEEQILMAMPYSPRHEDCGHSVLAEVNQDRPNPFAALAGLKSK